MKVSRWAASAGLAAVILTLLVPALSVNQPGIGLLGGLVAATIVALALTAGVESFAGFALVVALAGLIIGGISGPGHGAVAGLGLLAVITTSRICMDGRRPARVSTRTKRRLAAAPLAIGGVVVFAALSATWLANHRPPPIVTAVGILAAASGFFVAPLLRRTGAKRASRARRTPVIVMTVGLITLAIVAGASASRDEHIPTSDATVQADLSAATEPSSDIAEASGDGRPSETSIYTLGAAIIVLALLGSGLMRRPPNEYHPTPAMPADGEFAFVDQGEDDFLSADVRPAQAADVLGAALRAVEAVSDPRRSVRLAYATVERGFGELDIRRQHSESETEFLERLLPRLGAGSEAMRNLTDSFERARFSPHTITEANRQAAIDGLQEIRRQLDANAQASP